MNKWDLRFLQIASTIAQWSKDPIRKVGCVVIDDDGNQLSGGFNGFPRGILDNERLEDKVLKNKLVVHAEANAVCTAARNGHSIKGGIVYISCPPCSSCASMLIQAGVKRVVCYENANECSSATLQDYELSSDLFREAKIQFSMKPI